MIRLHRATTGALGRCFLTMILVFALARSLSAAPMVYTGIVVTDVRVGRTLMHNASLKITFEGDTDDIIQVVAPGTQTPIPSDECFGPGYFLYLVKGHARMEIESGGRTHRARLKDGQVFVAVDECHGGTGFGSFVGPNGLEPAYPFALTWGRPNMLRSPTGVPYGVLSALPGLHGHASAIRRVATTRYLKLTPVTAFHRTPIPSSRTSEISSSTNLILNMMVPRRQLSVTTLAARIVVSSLFARKQPAPFRLRGLQAFQQELMDHALCTHCKQLPMVRSVDMRSIKHW